VIVGVNQFQIPPEEDMKLPLLRVPPEIEFRQLTRLKRVRAERDSGAVEQTLARLVEACKTDQNTFPLILDAVRHYATVGEVCSAMKTVFGAYEETSVL
jgi:methylmalonyl-CoA mutase N-terminal domain/subunit